MHQTTDIYIGSTTQILCKRMSDHRRDYKNYLNNSVNYITSYEILKHGDAYIEVLFEAEFESVDYLRKKEGEYIRELKCVNKNIAGRTYKEWEEENKEKRSEQHKQYDKVHKQQIKEKNKNIMKITKTKF